ncbi:MAG: hypothetical protein HQ521_03625, partial [Bacteroidetes bacterium]|nr:hypothetical protein [Bacteroidota bacterium]
LNKIECKNYNEEYYLSEVVKKGETGYKIKIWVSVAPAKFWKFEVFTNENKTTTILTTGSGNLCDYWNTMELIGEGMIGVVSVICPLE